MPQVYKDFIVRCKDNIVVLNDTDFQRYLKMWNEMHPEHKFENPYTYPFNTRNDYLKRFYLYFEGGIYSDFDTEINE